MDQDTNSSDRNFNFSDYIDYDPESDDAKSMPSDTIEHAMTSVEQQRHEKLKAVVLEHIKSTQGQETESFVTKERFVCSLCFVIYLEKDQLKYHFINEHGYKEKKTPRNAKTKLAEYAVASSSQEKPIAATAVTADIPAWLDAPISLKVLKQKLYKSFKTKCSISGCFYQFEDDEKRKLHEKCHVSTDSDHIRLFKCLDCQIELKMWRNCTAHMWNEHKIDIDLLKCPCCTFRANLSMKIYRHMQVHKDLQGFECSLCPETFPQFTQLRVHVGTDHVVNNQSDANSRWYSKKTCEICSNVFANSKTLTKHVKTVHKRIKPFCCNICGYLSARKSTWEVHMRQHTGEKPMQCKVCSFCTADPSALRKHEMRHDDTVKYKCTECKYSCIQSINLKSHIKRHHPEYYSQLLCSKCSFVSVNLDALRKHNQDHNLGLIKSEDSNDTEPTHLRIRSIGNSEISSDCFLPVESTDSMPHEPPLDTGGFTIPAHHCDEAQFPN